MRGSWVIIIFSFLVGCNYHVDKTSTAGDAGNQSESIPGSQPVDWNLMRTNVLRSCLSCHSGGQSPNLSTYVQMKNEIGRVWGEVSSASMPPSSSGLPILSACGTALLQTWMNLGTPETSSVLVSSVSGCGSENPQPIPISERPLIYQTLHDQILVPRCLHCHNEADNTDAGAILFSPYRQLMAGARRWKAPGSSSKVVRLLRSTDPDERMPPGEDGPPLAEDEIKFIERWIDAGKSEF